MNRTILSLMVFFTMCTGLNAQFEQKVTINFAIGGISPLGTKDYQAVDEYDGSTYTSPHIFSNFSTGFALNGGLQYNINRRFSMVANVGFIRSGSWDYTENGVSVMEFEVTNPETGDGTGVWAKDELSVYNLNIGLMPKFYFFPGKKLNLYLFCDLNINYTKLNYIDNEYKKTVEMFGQDVVDFYYPDWGSQEKFLDNSFGVGFYPGLGFEFNPGKNIGFFAQGGYSSILINKDDLKDTGFDPENFNMLRAEVGVKLSFFKSKEL